MSSPAATPIDRATRLALVATGLLVALLLIGRRPSTEGTSMPQTAEATTGGTT